MKLRPTTLIIAVLAIFFVIAALVSGCTSQQTAVSDAQTLAANRNFYRPTYDVEFNNYNNRLKIADQPTTIWWCTSSFNQPSSPMFTVPIVGKLTSGSKRPFDTNLGPDGMYGSSSEYEYGFSPDGTYNQWNNIPLFCTTSPTVWQRESTTLVSGIDPALFAAQQAASEALARGDKAGAQKIITDAVKNAGGK